MAHHTFRKSEAGDLWKASFVLGLLTLMTMGANASTIAFKPAVNYTVGKNPRAVATGDFNGDGKLDLAVAVYGDPASNDPGSVTLLLGNGDGTYQAARNFAGGKNPCPALPCAMAVGDFNADGKTDIAVANSNNFVSVLLGNGDGTLQPSVEVTAGTGPQNVMVGDLNGDNRPDLVVANFGDSTVSVLLGNGDGTFQNHVDYPTRSNPEAVAVTDLNSDGKLDVVVAIGGSGIATLFGNGDGTLQSPVVCGCGAFSQGPKNFAAVGPIATADFNGDGRPDLILAFFHGNFPNTSYDEVEVLLGNGDGTFGPPAGTGVTEEAPPPSPAAADFDGDGRFDAAIAISGFVDVLPGNGDGSVRTAVNFDVGSGVQAYTTAITAADLNDDGSPDVVVTNSNDNTISVLLNTTGTDFSISASVVSPDTLGRGQSATSTVSLTLLNAFDNPVSLTCSVQPAQASSPTCSLNPKSVTFDAGGNGTAQMTITAGTSTASLSPPAAIEDSQPLPLLWLPIAGFAVAGAGFRRAGSKHRSLLGFFALWFLFAGLIFQSACGGSSSSSGPGSQAYTVTVTGTAGVTQHSTVVKVTVQ